LPVSVTSPIGVQWQLPAATDLLDRLQKARPDDRDHPLLRLRDHDLPRLELFPEGTRSRCTSTPAPSRAISASDDASPAAPQSWSDSTRPALDELDRDLDQLLAGERVADLDRWPLVGVVLAELGAREHGRAADPVAPVVAP
jgi:hypothetical protein